MTNLPAFARCAAVLGAALALSSCGGNAPDAAPASSTSPPTSATPTTAATPAPTVDAVLAKLAPAGATKPWIATAETDPNKLLGRPGQYTARAGFDLPGGDPAGETGRIERGGVIEIHPDAEAATARAKFIADTLKAGGPMLGVEYHYLAGPILVRVTGDVTPANAKKIEDAVATLPK